MATECYLHLVIKRNQPIYSLISQNVHIVFILNKDIQILPSRHTTLKQHHINVVKMLTRRCFDVMCLQGNLIFTIFILKFE